MNIIEQIESEQVAKLSGERPVPDFQAGDTLKVHVKVVEGTRERIQVFEGVVIARRNAGLNSSFTVRKISYGEGVERVFPLYSPRIDQIEIVRRGKVRRAKLYYMRDRRGKRARIAERTTGAAGKAKRAEMAEAAETKAKSREAAKAAKQDSEPSKAAKQEAKAAKAAKKESKAASKKAGGTK